jgi:hypothetical protein
VICPENGRVRRQTDLLRSKAAEIARVASQFPGPQSADSISNTSELLEERKSCSAELTMKAKHYSAA